MIHSFLLCGYFWCCFFGFLPISLTDNSTFQYRIVVQRISHCPPEGRCPPGAEHFVLLHLNCGIPSPDHSVVFIYINSNHYSKLTYCLNVIILKFCSVFCCAYLNSAICRCPGYVMLFYCSVFLLL